MYGHVRRSVLEKGHRYLFGFIFFVCVLTFFFTKINRFLNLNKLEKLNKYILYFNQIIYYFSNENSENYSKANIFGAFIKIAKGVELIVNNKQKCDVDNIENNFQVTLGYLGC